ncbi:transcription elongation factor B polypeptide 2 [Brachionus plicatilis]|uniref:Elongin-B n=1 Tax=Brachionus plicatilis TaxID=10195 RepID=A0A3M7S836_BRAPC|nr:transcription elongation factor B polypeptide 2 [Brachionus plicatilis]
MDVFLMIRRHKTTIFADAKETTTVHEVKKMVEGILKKAPEDQQLFKLTKDQPILMDDSKQLSDYGYTHSTARAQLPEAIGLAFREGSSEEFEPLEITPVSTPPDLPDVMKGDSTNSQSNMDSSDK